MKKQTFIQGAIILMAAGIITRILGFVPRMMLPRLIGAEGVGLYQMGYPLLIVLLTFITGGIPLAVSKLVAEAETSGHIARMRTILKLALAISTTIGILFTIALFATSSWITNLLFTDQRVHSTLVVMSPIIILVSISAVLRGYFQGRQNMIPTAFSQITETVVRAAAVLTFAYFMLPYGVEYAAAGAMAGVVAGELAGLLILLVQFSRSHLKRTGPMGNPPRSTIQTASAHNMLTYSFKRLMRISLPVTASKLVGSASYFLESVMIIQSLAVVGISSTLATAQYGALQGMVIPIVLLPTALTYSLSVSLIPSLSEAAAKGDRQTIHKRLHQSIRLAMVTGAPFTVIMYLLAEPLCQFLYRDASVASMLQWFAPVAIFVYLQAPFQASLQALDRPGTALLNTFVGAAIKLTLIYVLAAKAMLGIYGAVIAICVNIVLVTVLHGKSVKQLLQFRIRSIDLIKVGMSILVMTLSTVMLMQLISVEKLFGFLLVGALALLVYFLMIIRLNLIDSHDLRRLPWISQWKK